MAKFPDSSKAYDASSVGGAIDTSKLGSTVFEQPASPSQGGPASPPTPTTPAPVVSDFPPEGLVSPSPFRNLIPLVIGIAAFILLGFLAFTFLPRLLTGGGSTNSLTYWGLWEPSSVMDTVLADYERETGVKVNYTMQSQKGYRSRVQSAISAEGGPDIIRIHNTWLPMLKKQLAPAPSDLGINLSSYYPVVAKDFAVGSQIYALPLEIDGLALYYNKDILAETGATTPPTDWNAFRKLAFDLTRRSAVTGVIERAGAAIGTANNIDHWSDILGLLILQNSGNPATPSTQAVQDALTFYTIFATTDKSWDVSQPTSTYAFATGTVAMMLGPAWRAAEIEAINPSLNYGIAPAPTLPTTNLAWATYWAEAVPASSKNQQAAWEFIQYLSRPEVLQKLYAAEAALRPIGEPYPLTSLTTTLASDPLAAPFVSQGPNYTSWYLAGHTFDEGINDQLIKYYEDAINAINSGSTVNAIIKTLDAGVVQILAKFPEAK